MLPTSASYPLPADLQFSLLAGGTPFSSKLWVLDREKGVAHSKDIPGDTITS